MSVVVNGVTFTGSPCRVVETTFNGRYIKAGERTMALIFETDKMLRKHGCYLYIIQSAYNTGVPASAGTHDYDGCIDAYVIRSRNGAKVWIRGSRWLRRFHWFAWARRSGSWASPSSWHFHLVCIGVSAQCKVGIYVPGQEADGWAGKTGLAGHVFDPAWKPSRYTPFNFEKWYTEQEEDMGYAQWNREDKDAFWADFATRGAPKVWDAPANATGAGGEQFKDKTFRGLVKDIWNKTVGGGK